MSTNLPFLFFFFLCPSFTLPLFLSCFSRSLHTYINYTVVLRSYTYSVEIHARRLRRQARSGIEKMIFKPSFLFFFSFVFFCFSRPIHSIHPVFVHSRMFSLSHISSHRIRYFIYIYLRIDACVYVLRKETHVIFIYIHVSRVCFRLKHSVRLAVYYMCSFFPFYLKFFNFYNYIISIRLHARACSLIIYASFIRNICICVYM